MDSQNRNEKKNSSSINDEVQRLLRKNGKITPSDFIKLKERYGDDDLVDGIQNMYAEKYTHITQKAKKFAQLIRDKYSNSQTPFHILLEKAIKYKTKYLLSDDEFAEFQRIYEQELVGNKSTDIIRPQTNLMKVLGGITFDYNGFKSKLSDDDYKYLQEILKLHATTKPLHAQVLLQSMQYTDCAVESLSGTYNRDLNRIGDHVHPVIAALFLPKFRIVDEFFLWSNIAGIIKSRYNNERLHSRPDYELFYALTTDPNDIVCDNRSPILDLLNRAQLQSQLWNSVLHLRNGQYYNTSFKDFISSVDLCKLNKQDTPDLLYGRFDGIIIKRLLSAFSFRPTIVATTPLLLTSVALNPYFLNNKPLVTSVPMINMRLPPKLLNTNIIQLQDALEQTQFFLENGQIVPRSTSLIWSRGILIFYVDRRANTISYNEQLTRINMNILPASLSVSGGFERINKSIVIVNPALQFNNEDYELRSVVISETNQNNSINNNDLIIGSSTLIREPPNMITSVEYAHYYYDPYGPNKQNNDPITSINWNDPNSELSFLTMAQEVGIVFIYANKSLAINDKKDLVF